MTGPLYRADPPTMRLAVEAEGLTLLYHRPSGMTHVLGPPAPELLTALAEGPADAAEIVRRLRQHHDLQDDAGTEAVVAARLDELEAAGLVSRA